MIQPAFKMLSEKERREPMSERFSLGRRVRELRKAESMTMNALADAVGITQGHLSAIETSKTANPRIDVVLSIARCFGLTVSELLLETEPKIDNKLSILNQQYNELDQFGQEAVRLIVKHHHSRRQTGTD